VYVIIVVQVRVRWFVGVDLLMNVGIPTRTGRS